MSRVETSLETRVVHAGRPCPPIERAAVVPIFQCSVYEHLAEGTDYHDVRYPRLNNLPNHQALGRKLAALEGAEDAVVTASGMAAITTSLLAVLADGGHLLVQDQLYGGTHSFVVDHLQELGISYDFIRGDDPRSWQDHLRPDTRAIYVETLTNPLLRVADHRAVVGFAREHGLVSMVDNTFASPVNFRPIERGFDLSLHSATKYLNGHNDLVAGVVIGAAVHVQRARRLLDHLGGALDPHACFLLDRGVKTLVLRVRQQNATALSLAQRLAAHSAVARVHHPGLASHPDHARARELLDGFGGMISFEPRGGVDAARRFLERVALPIKGPSLGGVETLVTRPATTSHAGLSPEVRAQLGITDSLVRVSVGIEGAEDLIRDFEAALG
jgi:cystathionine beta-lyase/cystathionine gamma-synthase